jgi:MoCo/4Fe-4S cofactor protein with predicted Tat translocation signal
MKHHSAQREYWRSLEHLADSPLMQQIAQNEFVGYDPDDMMKMSDVTRRGFMKLVSASMALAGLTLTGCRRWPVEKLTPYTSNPHNRVPGVPEQYATIMEIDGVGSPLLVTSFDGRPIKIEGNPSHPFAATAPNIGAASVYSQASVLEMYDPQRSRGIVAGGTDSDWAGFNAAIGPVLDQLAGKQGDGLAILSEPLSGPSAQRLKAAVAAKFPKAQWCSYAPVITGNEAAGLKQAIGKPVRQMLHLNKAKVIVSIDADLLGSHPAKIRYASDWAAGRRSADEGEMSRVYVAESTFSTIGTVGDVRLAVQPSHLGSILSALGNAIQGQGGNVPLSPDEAAFVKQAAADVKANPGAAVIAVGEHLDPALHATAAIINGLVGAYGSTITLLDQPDDAGISLTDLVARIKSNAVSALVILGGNPAYDAPADLDFPGALKSVATSVHLSLYQNETSQISKWHVPRAHYLEAWSDARAWDGTISVCQPLIEPLFDGKTCDQILAMMAGESPLDSDAIVRKTFSTLITSGDFEFGFRKVLNDGLLPNSGFAEIQYTAPTSVPNWYVGATTQPASAGGMEVRFLQDASLYDGRFAPNGWLQELPDPLTKVVWDNPALLSIKDAQQLGVESGDVLNLTIGGRGLTIAAFVQPGQPEGVIGLSLGYGRSVSTHIGTNVGFNTYTVRTTSGMYSAQASQVAKTGETYPLATTQNQHLIDDLGAGGRDDRVGKEKYSNAAIIHEALFSDYQKDPKILKRNEDGSIPLQLFDSRPEPLLSEPHAWGMAIDMTSCIGCHACVVACQAENNIPIVGKDNVLNNREMHWIRIDRYFKGDPTAPEVVYQPMTCQQCENAPCEQVCPVGATMHDTEGLNVMVYNRCVGTRYCSNNCPYKVRRFNFLDWHAQDPRHDKYPKPFLNLPDLQDPQLTDSADGKLSAMVFNPEVTVRMRGVMEKCTYCIQRVHNTQTAKRANGEELKDGDIITACQQTCPTQAIVFGDLNDPNSKVSQLHRNNRAYGLLAEELNTRPRNRYLAKISNPPEA